MCIRTLIYFFQYFSILRTHYLSIFNPLKVATATTPHNIPHVCIHTYVFMHICILICMFVHMHVLQIFITHLSLNTPRHRIIFFSCVFVCVFVVLLPFKVFHLENNSQVALQLLTSLPCCFSYYRKRTQTLHTYICIYMCIDVLFFFL